MNVNKSVIGTTLVIMGLGIVHAWSSNPPQGITRVVLGGYVLMFLLSLFDLFGGGLAQVATAIALLALVSAIMLEGLPILQNIGSASFLNPGSAAPATGSTAPAPPSNPGTPGVNPA